LTAWLFRSRCDTDDDRKAVAISVAHEASHRLAGSQRLFIERIARWFAETAAGRSLAGKSSECGPPNAPQLAGIIDVAVLEPTVEDLDRYIVFVTAALIHRARHQRIQRQQLAFRGSAQRRLHPAGFHLGDQPDDADADGQQAHADDQHEACLETEALPWENQRASPYGRVTAL
jgi:hypothetical protein